jgi:hypothetical protein
MSDQRGYYSLIQFFPDASRLEGANVGVIVYSSAENRLQVRMSRSNQRIRKFFGNQNWNLVSRAKAAIVGQLQSQLFLSVQDLESYISKRANAIQLTPPRPMRISNLEADADRLFERLVGPDLVETRRRVSPNLKKRFLDAGVASFVQNSVSIEISTMKKSIRVPYAYQNGRFNLITPVQFDPDTESILTKTGKSRFEGQLLRNEKHPSHGEMQLVVVANFDESIEQSTREFVTDALRDSSVTVYTLENLDPLIEDIKHSAASHAADSQI